MDEDAKHLWMNKNIFFIIAVGILLIGIVSAQTYKQDSIIDLKISTNETNCQITIEAPNSSTLIFNQSMTSNPAFVNYTFNQTGSTGIYYYFIDCDDSYLSDSFKVTPSGDDALTSGEGIIFLGSLIAMLSVAGVFLFLSISVKEHDGTRFAFTSLTVITCMIIVLYSSVALSETFWGFDRIISSYSTFLWVFLFIIFIIFIFVLIWVIVKALDSVRIKKGLKEQ